MDAEVIIIGVAIVAGVVIKLAVQGTAYGAEKAAREKKKRAARRRGRSRRGGGYTSAVGKGVRKGVRKGKRW